MADCLADLILRPGINPPVQIGLTLVAGVDTLAGGDEPGELDGHPVPAVLVRELAYTLGLLPRPDDPPPSRHGPTPTEAVTTGVGARPEPADRARRGPTDQMAEAEGAEPRARDARRRRPAGTEPPAGDRRAAG